MSTEKDAGTDFNGPDCPAAPEEVDLNTKVEGGAICPLTGSIQCALTDTRESMVRLEAEVRNLRDDVCEVKDEVFGNGKPGLKTEMIRLRMVMSGVKWAASILGGAILLDIAIRLIQTLAPHAPVVLDTTSKVLSGG